MTSTPLVVEAVETVVAVEEEDTVVPEEVPEEVPDEVPEEVPDEVPVFEEVPDEVPEEVPDEEPEVVTGAEELKVTEITHGE